MVRHLSSRELVGKRQRLKILSRHTGINQPVYNLESETPIIARITKYYTARCAHCFKSSERAFH